MAEGNDKNKKNNDKINNSTEKSDKSFVNIVNENSIRQSLTNLKTKHLKNQAPKEKASENILEFIEVKSRKNDQTKSVLLNKNHVEKPLSNKNLIAFKTIINTQSAIELEKLKKTSSLQDDHLKSAMHQQALKNKVALDSGINASDKINSEHVKKNSKKLKIKTEILEAKPKILPDIFDVNDKIIESKNSQIGKKSATTINKYFEKGIGIKNTFNNIGAKVENDESSTYRSISTLNLSVNKAIQIKKSAIVKTVEKLKSSTILSEKFSSTWTHIDDQESGKPFHMEGELYVKYLLTTDELLTG
ncbi:hypothetical protein HELRODRAFT_165037 [Helobdella robusta]|uniref:Uncharacterized protein n=1 Tax=Helobdella robusta TaxID=6412 RepID=T1EW62_HELRO|nr:hypothetical protein HELRODRAFT_165037 [Helobdella robusta]ESN92900.1 hypothetical protein HELRODRAFT_165037 [Helobdella robusta]